MDKVGSQCPNFGHLGDNSPVYYWREIKLFKHGMANYETNAIEIYCLECNRTISVIPYHQFFAK